MQAAPPHGNAVEHLGVARLVKEELRHCFLLFKLAKLTRSLEYPGFALPSKLFIISKFRIATEETNNKDNAINAKVTPKPTFIIFQTPVG